MKAPVTQADKKMKDGLLQLAWKSVENFYEKHCGHEDRLGTRNEEKDGALGAMCQSRSLPKRKAPGEWSRLLITYQMHPLRLVCGNLSRALPVLADLLKLPPEKMEGAEGGMHLLHLEDGVNHGCCEAKSENQICGGT